MATVKRFEEIEAWQTARSLTKAIYDCSNVGAFARDYGLRDQIRRAAVSVMSNIAEGFERGGTAEFLQFLSVSKGSAGEVEAQLYVALDQGYITEDEFTSLQGLAQTTKRLIAGFIRYLRECEMRGLKYKRLASKTGEPGSSNLKARNPR